ncbi:bifunctional lysylphosphatidylglycerol flippase/synthetase MprF [Ponticoccus alexandrii]|uniref:Bifunctional lysylphosphatidylglycerol flippase/synthetase MprF n=1 Tax=Ponticoccus alexandrii TaxID=1943633 RepID=A0ABX7FFD7_9RHOB|nr:bifunctional lysylphosphatidylglycerol flippase/synthetase MprF [Ponticoccus alexandrii]QRF68641.1 bifunctional lysylphosphatidylglycerol flippase/synthetase MprF [Ponticoccus alexandrii]
MTTAMTRTRLSRVLRMFEHPAFKIVIPLVIGAIAVVVLHRLASHVRWTDVRVDLGAAQPTILLAALGCTIVSFAGIAAYDALAVRAVAPGVMPRHIPLVGGAAGYAISGLLGVSYLTGTAVRHQVYSSFGLDLVKITAVVAISWTGFLSALILCLGALLAFHPTGLSAVIAIAPAIETAAGLVLLFAFGGYLVWLAKGKRQVTTGDHVTALPGPSQAIGLTLAGLLDLSGAALTLYVLMPADLVQSLPFFAIVFVAAVGLGVLSHAPGGLGAFEATMIAGLGAAGRSDALAALLLYRMIYTVFPFVVAALGLSIAAALAHRGKLHGTSSALWRAVKPFVPTLAAALAMLAGIVLLVSGNLPAEGSRLEILRDIFPLGVVEASNVVGSLVGALLIVVAAGLYRKLYRAWLLVMILLGVGFVASLAKGLDWVEALSMLGTLVALGLIRPAFYRADDMSLFRLDREWLLSLLVLSAAIVWIGFFAYDHVDYRNALWWQFTWDGDASRFLRASLVLATVLSAVAVNSLINHRRRLPPTGDIPEIVRRLVAQSEDTEANIALTGDKQFLISPDETAFLAYADTGKSLIAQGDPVGEAATGRALIWALREQAYRAGKRVAFYSVSAAYLPTYLDLGLSILKIGEVARVDLSGFSLDGSKRKGLRQARNRSVRDGYVFEVVPQAEAQAILPELRHISDAWLAHKQGEEKGFSLGAFTDEYMRNFDMAVLRDAEGRIVAFANLFQGAEHSELSLDLMRYLPDAPHFAMDALFAEMLLWGATQGYRWMSLGAAPFAGVENRQLAPLWNRIGGFIYEHGDHFYNFEGLRSFKEKFDPIWSPNYLACPGGLAAPGILYEVNVLVSGGLRGLMK